VRDAKLPTCSGVSLAEQRDVVVSGCDEQLIASLADLRRRTPQLWIECKDGVNDKVPTQSRFNPLDCCRLLLSILVFVPRKGLNRCVGRDQPIADWSVNDYAGKLDSTSARGSAYAHSALGEVRKRALDIVIAGIVPIMLVPILLVTGGLIRLLIGNRLS
jgi:hypothetical protein